MSNIKLLSDTLECLKDQPGKDEIYFCLGYDQNKSVGLLQGYESELTALILSAMDDDSIIKNVVYKCALIHQLKNNK